MTVCMLTRKKTMNADTEHLELIPERPVTFTAGQFVIIELKGLKKPYSIASAPWEKTLHLCIKNLHNGKMSEQLCSLRCGEEVEFDGPKGIFHLQEQTPEHYLFIGTGTGIAPIRSMIRSLLQKTLSRYGEDTSSTITLLQGAKTGQEALYQEEFENLPINYTLAISREEQGTHVQDFVQSVIKEKENTHVFICGQVVMVGEVKEQLIKLGVRESNIFTEGYG